MRRRFFFFPLIGIAIVALASAAVMLLWNALLPPLLNAGPVTYWQALGLLVLARLLFGGMHHGWRHHHRHPHMSRERWMQLSEEERQHLREHWHNRCGCGWHKAPTEPPTTPA
ncbi:MAG TPA: hypothetical protein VGL38_09760 [bacterium]|jgi:hypothetical protein